MVESVQVAPQLATSEILVQTKVHNYGPARSFRLVNRVENRVKEERVQIGGGRRKDGTPEDPNAGRPPLDAGAPQPVHA